MVGNYNLETPSWSSAVSAFSKFGNEQAVNQLLQSYASKCDTRVPTNDIEELERILREISKESNSFGVVARSLVVKLTTFKLLNK